MATPQQKAFCVLRFAKSESVIIVQREFRKQFQSNPPGKTNILQWYRQFQENGCICKGESPGRPRISEENVNRIRVSYAQSPCKSLSRGSHELSLPQTTLGRVLRKSFSGNNNNKNCVVLFRKRTIPTERPQPVVEVLVPTLADRGCHVVSATDPHGRNLSFLDPNNNNVTIYSRTWL
jgi:hypothetical protein